MTERPMFNPGAPVVYQAPVDTSPGPLTAWSFSTLKNFESCAHRAYLKGVKRLKEPGSPAMDRGSMVHDEAEAFVKGEIPFPVNLKKMEADFEQLKEMYDPTVMLLEKNWGFTQQWKDTGWMSDDVWHRSKLDNMYFESQTSAVIIDYKTGKKFGNELKHGEQLMLYAVVAFVKFPRLQFIKVENWYTDHNEKLTKTYTRETAMLFFPRWAERGLTMTTAKEFPPSPSKPNCKWCPFAKTGDCVYAVE